VLERRDDEVVARVDDNRHATDIWTCVCVVSKLWGEMDRELV
jgi:hypothetical protein